MEGCEPWSRPDQHRREPGVGDGVGDGVGGDGVGNDGDGGGVGASGRRK